jgi:hypothetical protein
VVEVAVALPEKDLTSKLGITLALVVQAAAVRVHR